MELKQIQDLIKFVAKSGVEEVELEQDNFKITIKARSPREFAEPQQIVVPANMLGGQMQQMAAPTPSPTPAAPVATPAPQPAATPVASGTEIKAPMIGTFYRSSGPDKEPFVKVGDMVEIGQTVCIIEAMKLFNEIESDVAGRVVKVLTDDASPVEYDQPLFLVEPA
ncbi:MAG: acetyl-CoA carboxylase biotin carboxyl carrier protein [Bacteroidetes bacterium]|nr:acetyl-CoA carboxylase biotin carboxyl carrier protein [Bacteroidota bacterium]